MENEIKLLKNNSGRIAPDLEWVEEFYKFLQGEIPSGMRFGRGHKPKMSAKKAFSIIWYLQEHLPVFPDTIEVCWNCGYLFDADEEGLYWETKGRHYCCGCWHLVPENYDRGKR